MYRCNLHGGYRINDDRAVSLNYHFARFVRHTLGPAADQCSELDPPAYIQTKWVLGSSPQNFGCNASIVFLSFPQHQHVDYGTEFD